MTTKRIGLRRTWAPEETTGLLLIRLCLQSTSLVGSQMYHMLCKHLTQTEVRTFFTGSQNILMHTTPKAPDWTSTLLPAFLLPHGTMSEPRPPPHQRFNYFTFSAAECQSAQNMKPKPKSNWLWESLQYQTHTQPPEATRSRDWQRTLEPTSPTSHSAAVTGDF